MPHPNERKIVMQIQTVAGKCTPIEAFKKGLEDLQEMCKQIKETFQVKESDRNPVVGRRLSFIELIKLDKSE